ncbi:isoflavone reductase family protein [Lophiotrema nucula]|uniref:Isoflavone reductase family protein n=1 Tax=Lophiotrema nucula TaxID=690887 RepID=A0A6A5YHM8_9PLEO|nr:isoflavone reductase family protein [Lophiotrema nucula]
MAPIKNIVWSGTGKTGVPILERLLATKQFNIKLLVRNSIASYSDLPQNIPAHQVDYADHARLVDHLRGQDAVVVFCSFVPGSGFDTKHIALVNAAIEAGVKYFIPSEWALDTAGIMGSTSGRHGPTLPTNMVLAPKRVSHNYMLCRAAEGKINFAAIYCGVLIESLRTIGIKGPMLGFNFETKTANLPDNGVNPFPASSYTTLTKALSTLLSEPTKISNRFYHISDGVLTLRDCFSIVQGLDSTAWMKTSFSTEVVRDAALQNIQRGVFTPKEFVHTLMTAFFGGIQVFSKLDNETLGIADGEEMNLREVMKGIAQERL